MAAVHNLPTNSSRETLNSIFFYGFINDFKYIIFHVFVRARFQPGQKGFFKGFLSVHMSTLTFLFIYFLYFFLGGANRLYVLLLLLYHEFEQFG